MVDSLLDPEFLERYQNFQAIIPFREEKPMNVQAEEASERESNRSYTAVPIAPTTTVEDHIESPQNETSSKGQWLNSVWGMQNKASKIIRALDGIVGPPEELAGKEDLPKNVCAAQDLMAEMWILSSMLERIEAQVENLQEYIDWQ